jgi:hypothetical protein
MRFALVVIVPRLKLALGQKPITQANKRFSLPPNNANVIMPLVAATII